MLLVFLTEFGLCMRLATSPLKPRSTHPPPHPHPPQFKTYVPLAGHTVRAKKRKSVLILQFFVESKTGSKESEDRTVNPEAFSDVDLVLPIGHLGMWNKAMIYLSDCQR